MPPPNAWHRPATLCMPMGPGHKPISPHVSSCTPVQLTLLQCCGRALPAGHVTSACPPCYIGCFFLLLIKLHWMLTTSACRDSAEGGHGRSWGDSEGNPTCLPQPRPQIPAELRGLGRHCMEDKGRGDPGWGCVERARGTECGDNPGHGFKAWDGDKGRLGGRGGREDQQRPSLLEGDPGTGGGCRTPPVPSLNGPVHLPMALHPLAASLQIPTCTCLLCSGVSTRHSTE